MPHYGLEAKSYRVSIAAAGLGGAAPADGFIDHLTVQHRVAAGDTAPTTTAQTQAKERANIRYRTIVDGLNFLANATISNQIATGATATAAATTFQFDIYLERGDDSIANESLTGAAAVERLVARALMVGEVARSEYSDPTTSAAVGDNVGQLANRRGEVVADLTVGALTAVLATAETAITVTAL